MSNKRKILINEKQEEIINNLRESETILPPHLRRDIEYNNTSLSQWDFMNSPSGRMLLQIMTINRFNEVESHFSDDVSNVSKEEIENRLRETIEKCRIKEDNIRPQLEELCITILTDIFNLPENSFSLNCSLVSDIDADKEFNVTPVPANTDYSTIDDFDNETSEIVKRRIINCLSMGIAMKISERCLNEYMQKIFEMNEELPYLYSRFLKLNDLYLLKTDIKIKDKAHQQGGYVEVILGNEDTLPIINAKGKLFPILLTEAIKGFMELFASHGLPDDINLSKKVISIADALVNEPWDMRLGTILYDKVFKSLRDVDSYMIPYFYTRLVKRSSNEFMNIMKAVLCDVEDVKEYLNILYDDAKKDKEQEEFDCQMMQKQDEGNDLIIDQEEIL